MGKIKEGFVVLSHDAYLDNNGVTTVDRQRITLKNYRAGNELPNWKQIIDEGGNATTELSAYRESASNSVGWWKGVEQVHPTLQRSYGSNRQGLNFGVNPKTVGENLVREAEADALTKAYKIINRLTSQLSGQVMLGEIRETKRLLRKPFHQTIELMESFIKKKGRGNAVAGQWLEFQFGLMPLLTDIDAIIGMLNEQVERNRKMNFRTYGAKESSETTVDNAMLDIYGFYQNVERVDSLKAEHIIRFAITREFLDKANYMKSDFAGQFSQLSDLPMTAWELLPWSFLIDYVVNVSAILQAATTCTTGLAYVSQSSIRTHTHIRTGSTTHGAATRYTITENVPRRFVYKKRLVDRTGKPLGIPSVVFSLPGSNIRYMNIVALIASLTLQRRT